MGLLLPVSCVVCARPGGWVCGACTAALPADGVALDLPGLVWCRARFPYSGGADRLVTALKYRNAHPLAAWLATLLVPVVHADGSSIPIAAVTWAPTAPARRRRRGFDQAELLARALARLLVLPALALLARADGGGQTGADRATRTAGPRFGPRPTARQVWSARRAGAVLVVDDVITTGATMAAAAHCLAARWAVPVVGVAVAHTPRHHGRRMHPVDAWPGPAPSAPAPGAGPSPPPAAASGRDHGHFPSGE